MGTEFVSGGKRSPRPASFAARHPLRPVVIFVIAGLVVLTLARVVLVTSHWERVESARGLGPVLRGGLRIDLSLLALLSVFWVAVAPWAVGASRAARAFRRLQSLVLTAALAGIVFLEIATPAFVEEFGVRPNRLFLEYLDAPREVGATLWGAYRTSLILAACAMAAVVWVSWRLMRPAKDVQLPSAQRPILSVAAVALCLLAARSGLQHRPINPAAVAFCDDPLLNSLALNSLYNVGYEAYRLRKEIDTEELYGRLPTAEMLRRVRAAAGIPAPPLEASNPALHRQLASMVREKPLNLVLIVEESLGARYVGSLGGLDLTPELDALSEQGWWFTRMYATGTRSARGLEALVSGFPPSPARAVLDLPRAQGGFFTLAGLLRQIGYRTRFVYGGEGHFDNMQGFFLANGFHEAIDGDDYEAPVFRGSWGVSDEDVLERVHQELSRGGDPQFVLAFTVSNHSPWEFPPGRVVLQESPAATRHNSVQYADWALGDFFRKARAAPYWDNTLFVVVADHDSRIYGRDLVPLERFRIPALILGPGVPTRSDGRLVSQIDLVPTLLSLLGIDSTHPLIGRDLCSLPVGDPGRAILQYDRQHAYWQGEHVVVHRANQPPLQFRCDGGALEPEALDPELCATALAHALWPGWVYLQHHHTGAEDVELRVAGLDSPYTQGRPGD